MSRISKFTGFMLLVIVCAAVPPATLCVFYSVVVLLTLAGEKQLGTEFVSALLLLMNLLGLYCLFSAPFLYLRERFKWAFIVGITPAVATIAIMSLYLIWFDVFRQTESQKAFAKMEEQYASPDPQVRDLALAHHVEFDATVWKDFEDDIRASLSNSAISIRVNAVCRYLRVVTRAWRSEAGAEVKQEIENLLALNQSEIDRQLKAAIEQYFQKRMSERHNGSSALMETALVTEPSEEAIGQARTLVTGEVSDVYAAEVLENLDFELALAAHLRALRAREANE